MLSLAFFSFAIVSCDDDDDDDNNNSNNTPFIASQADLNAATNVFELNITGKPYGDATVAHNGSTLPPDSTFRDVYSNLANKTDAISKGTIITKHTFLTNPDGSKGDLAVTFAMIKREAGYYTDGGDWEYVMMPFDANVDYTTMKNGMLPDQSATTMRGQLNMCASCHASGGNDYLFVR